MSYLVYEDYIRIPIYNQHITFIITTDIDRFCDESGITVDRNTTDAGFVALTDRLVVIFNSEKLFEGYIVHESFHITAYIMRYIGCTLTEESEETYAYLIEWVYKSLRKLIIKFKQNGYTDKSEEV